MTNTIVKYTGSSEAEIGLKEPSNVPNLTEPVSLPMPANNIEIGTKPVSEVSQYEEVHSGNLQTQSREEVALMQLQSSNQSPNPQISNPPNQGNQSEPIVSCPNDLNIPKVVGHALSFLCIRCLNMCLMQIFPPLFFLSLQNYQVWMFLRIYRRL